MIIVAPNTTPRHAATDSVRIHANYIFAQSLVKYIKTKGDTCMMSVTSETDTSNLGSLYTKYNPEVCLFIDCYTDISADSKGYDVVSSVYSALVGTITYEMSQQSLKPLQDKGYDIHGSKKYSQYGDIYIYLGFVTNTTDLAFISDSTKLDTVAKRIIEGSYGPPVKTLKSSDVTGLSDPYFYKISDWAEDTAVTGATGEIDETTYSGIPVRYLALHNEDADSDYTWSLATDYSQVRDCLILLSVRSKADTVTALIKIGDTEYTEDISDSTFILVQTESTVNILEPIHIGIRGAGSIDYTAVWVTPKGVLGALDDPRTDYSIFPPGYRLTTTISYTETPSASIQAALTTAASLISRAQDTTDIVEAATDTATVTQTSTSDSTTVYSTKDYAASVTDIVSILAKIDPSNPVSVLASGLSTDYSKLQASLSSITETAKKQAVALVINDLKTVNACKNTAMTQLADLKAEAKKKLTAVQGTITNKGGNLGS